MMKKLKNILRRIWIPAILAMGLCSGVGYWNSFQVSVKDVMIYNQGFSRVFHGKTIVHITDLHMDVSGIREKKVLDLLATIKPDWLFLTGDYIQWNGDVNQALDFLSRMRSTSGSFAVTGDYDSSNSRTSCLFCHEKGSRERTRSHTVQMLNNSGKREWAGENYFHVYGVTENNQETEAFQKHLLEIPLDQPLIVLSHNPLNFDLVDNTRNVFMMAGDTHGGQIPLPSFVWKALGYEKNRKYNSGLFTEGNKKMYVSRGVGTSHLPIRLFCPAEIVVYHFQPETGK